MLDSISKNTFRKPEKICHQNQIDCLFREGKSIKSGHFKMLFRITESTGKVPVQVLIAVPKKNLRHAVTRNRMKRLVREAYRIGKHNILKSFVSTGKHCDIAFVFLGKECISQAETSAAINELLDRLLRTNEKNSE